MWGITPNEIFLVILIVFGYPTWQFDICLNQMPHGVLLKGYYSSKEFEPIYCTISNQSFPLLHKL